MRILGGSCSGKSTLLRCINRLETFTDGRQAQTPDGIASLILQTVQQRGKQHNPVTGSGGMLIGVVRQVGKDFSEQVEVGTKIATLVSLSLTPLQIDEIHEMDMDTCQVRVSGQAILFQSGIFAKLPEDLPQEFALGLLDVGRRMRAEGLL